MPPLTYPDPDDDLSIAALAEFDAIELSGSARRLWTRFSVDEASGPAMPESADGWMDFRSQSSWQQRASGIFRSRPCCNAWEMSLSPRRTVSRAATAPITHPRQAQRHQSLRDTIAWSYDLLDAEEQALFQRLAIFVGGWTIEAAEAVLRHEPITRYAGWLDVAAGQTSGAARRGQRLCATLQHARNLARVRAGAVARRRRNAGDAAADGGLLPPIGGNRQPRQHNPEIAEVHRTLRQSMRIPRRVAVGASAEEADCACVYALHCTPSGPAFRRKASRRPGDSRSQRQPAIPVLCPHSSLRRLFLFRFGTQKSAYQLMTRSLAMREASAEGRSALSQRSAGHPGIGRVLPWQL